MPTRMGERWKAALRPLGEIAVVTVGILIAFALEAWWDNRATAAQEQVHLRALASDLAQNVSTLEALIANEEDLMASCGELLRRLRGEAPASKAKTGDLLSEVFSSLRYEPVMGAYEALVNSGGLTLIRDEALRAALAAYAAELRGRYEESWSDDHYFAFAREYAGPFMIAATQETDAAARERVYEAFLRDPRFREHLALRYYSERDMARKYRGLLEQAQKVRAQVQAQIEAD
jgi:Family of unknown function (DUF6090)